MQFIPNKKLRTMRLSIIRSREINQYGLPEEIQVVATVWLIKVGILKAMLGEKDPNRYIVYVKSYRSGKGIAKLLLLKINEIFQELARKNKVIIRHVVHFLSDESEMKLTKYYRQLGYTKEGELLVKMFKP